MGIYINKGNGLFRQARNSEYIDSQPLSQWSTRRSSPRRDTLA